MAASRFIVDEAMSCTRCGTARPHAPGYAALQQSETADVVAYAHEHGTPVRVIWPNGAQCN
jgi:hypothetical protein